MYTLSAVGSSIKIATWNINSVRLRCDLVLEMMREEGIDVLCLQETKVQDGLFPVEPFTKAGYEFIATSGQKSYNGVAIISRIRLENIHRQAIYNDDARHISASLPCGTRLHNIYIPAGGDVPDAQINPKFAHKLEYIRLMAEYLARAHDKNDRVLLMGDFNIAPLPEDVWSHKQLLDVVSHTPIEVETLERLRLSLDFCDIARKITPPPERLYSWWSYRNRDWRKSNRGRRLDHIWATKPTADDVTSCSTPSHWRNSDKPSDHIPVIIDYER